MFGTRQQQKETLADAISAPTGILDRLENLHREPGVQRARDAEVRSRDALDKVSGELVALESRLDVGEQAAAAAVLTGKPASVEDLPTLRRAIAMKREEVALAQRTLEQSRTDLAASEDRERQRLVAAFHAAHARAARANRDAIEHVARTNTILRDTAERARQRLGGNAVPYFHFPELVPGSPHAESRWDQFSAYLDKNLPPGGA